MSASTKLGQCRLRLFRRKLAGRQSVLDALLGGGNLTGNVCQTLAHCLRRFLLKRKSPLHNAAKRGLRIAERVSRLLQVWHVVANALFRASKRSLLEARHLGHKLRRQLDAAVRERFCGLEKT